MIGNDPWLHLQRRQQTFLALSMVLIGICLLAYLVSLFLPAFNIGPNTVSSIVFMGSIFVFTIMCFLSQRNALKRYMQRHQRLLAGDASLLAEEQPSPNEHVLSLPTMIALRPKSGTVSLIYGMLVFIALFFASLMIWALVAFFTTPYDTSGTGNDLIFAAIAGSLTLFLGACIWFLWSRSRYWVKATDTGLEARFNGRRMQIAWRDARFFSVGGMLSPGRPHVYTLSGEQGGVIWLQLLSEYHPGLQRSALPFDLYQRQSQALLEVVASRTNLPLYDMRLPANKWYL